MSNNSADLVTGCVEIQSLLYVSIQTETKKRWLDCMAIWFLEFLCCYPVFLITRKTNVVKPSSLSSTNLNGPIKKFESLKIQLKRTAAFESWGFNLFSNVDESSRDITYEWTKSYGWKTRPKREYSLLGRKTLRIGSPAKNIHQAWWILA